MDAVRILIFLLAGASFSNIVAKEALFHRIREKAFSISPTLGEALSCSTCFGFWAGLILTFIPGLFEVTGTPFDHFIGALCVSLVSKIVQTRFFSL